MNYTEQSNFEWDEDKSRCCLHDRGFDFAYAAYAFGVPQKVVRRDRRQDYGEDRYQLIGRIADRVFVVIFTQRLGAIRIISARKANRREVWQYENCSYEN